MRILIVEDDLTFAVMIQTWLRKKGFDVEKAASIGEAVKLLSGQSSFDLVLSDMRLPDNDGIFLLSWMKKKNISCPFIVMTNYAEVQNAVLAMKSGASDYIAKPMQPDVLLQKISDALNLSSSTKVLNNTSQEGSQKHLPQYIEGNSEASKKIREFISLVAPTSMSVLILGASGTGKEHVARQIHSLSSRKNKPFVAIDCGTIPRDVAVSEFFGYEKGAFTGATTTKEGAFESANGGTLFLDEIGNLSYDVQMQLLRALQEHKIRRLGSTREISVDIRLVCATNGNLLKSVTEGNFREDLYHRINEFTINIPEIKDRGNDLFIFADFFLKQANNDLSRKVLGFDDKASEMLASYSWPGNLRELNNVIRRATLMTRGKYITKEDLSSMMPSVEKQAFSLHDENTERQRILSALKSTQGNRTQTAKLLGIDRKTLYNKMQKYGL